MAIRTRAKSRCANVRPEKVSHSARGWPRHTFEALEKRELLSAAFFVTPITTPVDPTHYHSLAAALAALSPAGTITILNGAQPDVGTVVVSPNGISIIGDPNVADVSLPTENLAIAGTHDTLSRLHLGAVTINNAANTETIANSDIQTLTIVGYPGTGSTNGNGFNLITNNVFHGAISVTGNNFTVVTNDTFTHNTIYDTTSSTAVSVSRDVGFTFTDNTIVGDATCTVGLSVNIVTTGITVSRNNITVATRNGAAFYSAPAAPVSGKIFDNVFSTAGLGFGVSLMDGGGTSNVAFEFQGNDFTNNAVGFKMLTNNSTTDLGGGSLGSTGGNDFRNFDGVATYAIQLIGVSGTKLFALNNLFPVGSTGSNVVQIINAGTVQTSALTASQALVDNLFHAFLHRTPAAADYTFWGGVYTASGQAAVINGIQKSSEALGNLVNSEYLQYLNRTADSAGLNFWIGQLQNGMTQNGFTAALLSSTEFIAGHNADYIQSLYINVLKRTADPASIAFWYTQISSLGLTGVASAILSSSEYRSDIITLDFNTYLHRDPSGSDVSYFVGQNLDPLVLQFQVMNTTEYLNRG